MRGIRLKGFARRTVISQGVAEHLLGFDLIPEGVVRVTTEGRNLTIGWIEPKENLGGHWLITAPQCETIMVLRGDPLGLKR